MKSPLRFMIYATTSGEHKHVVVLSPDEMNANLSTVIAAPILALKGWPTRVRISFGGGQADIALEQLSTLDASQLGDPIEVIDSRSQSWVLCLLIEMFAP